MQTIRSSDVLGVRSGWSLPLLESLHGTCVERCASTTSASSGSSCSTLLGQQQRAQPGCSELVVSHKQPSEAYPRCAVSHSDLENMLASLQWGCCWPVCRLWRLARWLVALSSTRTKFRQGDVMQIFKAVLDSSHVAFDDQGNFIT